MAADYGQIISKLDKNELWDFPGGVFPPQHKAMSNQTPIEKTEIPEQLFVSLKQHIGVEGHLEVEVGQKVLKGQPLTKSMNPFAVPVHSPTSGEITAITPHVSAHPSGLAEMTVTILSDQQDKWTELRPLMDYQNVPKMQLLEAICDAGISGMGGAGFPTHIKSAPKKDVDFLIINGIECEPYITSDDRLMREHAWQIRQGIDVLCHLLTPKSVLIGIEDNKPEAIEAMQVACRENPNYRICEVPTKYPAGGEKQLIQVLTNREVPTQGLPIDVGVIMHNVGTCYAIADAVFAGKPLIERVVTLSGAALENPGNIWALIGTPVSHLLAYSGYQPARQKAVNLIMGGPMMGFNLSSDQTPVVKITNCILAPSSKEMHSKQEQACIRCGACADACPASLLPQQLFWHAKAKELDKAQDYHLFDCIECGACAYVCPSEIPLVHYYRIAKSEIRVEQAEKQKSDKARERFEKREARLIAEQQARDEKHRLAAEARKQAMSAPGNSAKDKIAAALARAKAKKQGSNSDTASSAEGAAASKSSPSSSKEQLDIVEKGSSGASANQRVQAAIQRAKAKKAAAAASGASKSSAGISNKDAVSKPQHDETAETELTKDKKIKPTRPEQEKTKDTSNKQAKIAAAVAKAKAKRAAQKQAAESDSITQNEATLESPVEASQSQQQMDMKKQRIAAAVAKAKAKKAAERQKQKDGDKS